MSTIGTAAPYTGDIPQLFGNASGAPGAADAPGSSATAGSDPTSGSPRDPATRVDLSDKVKAILARASSDQDVADRLKAFVQSHRIGGTMDPRRMTPLPTRVPRSM